MTEAACYRYVHWFTFFFIPVFPFCRDHPYLGCTMCRQAVQLGSAANVCVRCGQWVEGQQRFCPNCGELNRTCAG